MQATPSDNPTSDLPPGGRARLPGGPAAETISTIRGLTSAEHLTVVCPHCREPFETPLNTPVADIVCVLCGGGFSLAEDKETSEGGVRRTIGHFDLIERVGMGGFGAVWRGRDTSLDRTVAVKIPRRTGMSVAEEEKFLREARAAAQLRHPNIVSVHEVGRDGDTVYIVSDFVRGVSLHDWLTVGVPAIRDALDIGIIVAEALHHAHDQGVIHRDLKPSNILIDSEGEAFLTDFGLAKREAGEVTVTVEGQVLGTPAYMSPEQARGEGHSADCRTDVYALGVVLFEMVTGERPFRGNTRMLLHQVLNDEPPSPRRLNAAVSRDLETVILKCLEKDRAKRYATAREVSDELQRVKDRRPIRARPVGALESAWRWYHRNAAASIVTAGAYAVIVSIMLILWGLFGIFLIVSRILPESTDVLLQLVALVGVAYPLILVAGLATVNKRIWGLWLGAAVSLVWTIVSLVVLIDRDGTLLSLAVLTPHDRHPYYHFQTSSLILLIAGTGAALYLAAIVSWLRGPSGVADFPQPVRRQRREITSYSAADVILASDSAHPADLSTHLGQHAQSLGSERASSIRDMIARLLGASGRQDD